MAETHHRHVSSMHEHHTLCLNRFSCTAQYEEKIATLTAEWKAKAVSLAQRLERTEKELKYPRPHDAARIKVLACFHCPACTCMRMGSFYTADDLLAAAFAVHVVAVFVVVQHVGNKTSTYNKHATFMYLPQP
jgi:hypothetical protein